MEVSVKVHNEISELQGPGTDVEPALCLTRDHNLCFLGTLRDQERAGEQRPRQATSFSWAPQECRGNPQAASSSNNNDLFQNVQR